MNEKARSELSRHRLHRAAMALVAFGVATAANVHAARPSNIIVPAAPAQLPTSACQTASGPFQSVLESPRARDPQLKTVPGLTLPGLARGYQVVDAVSSYELDRIFDVKQVRFSYYSASPPRIARLPQGEVANPSRASMPSWIVE
jgi:hypothetical protein